MPPCSSARQDERARTLQADLLTGRRSSSDSGMGQRLIEKGATSCLTEAQIILGQQNARVRTLRAFGGK